MRKRFVSRPVQGPEVALPSKRRNIIRSGDRCSDGAGKWDHSFAYSTGNEARGLCESD